MASSSQKSDQIVTKDFGGDPNNLPKFWFCEDPAKNFESTISKIVDDTVDRISNCDENSNTVRNNNFQQLFQNIKTLKPGSSYKGQNANLQCTNPEKSKLGKPVINEVGSKNWIDVDHNDFIFSTKKPPPISRKHKITSPEMQFQKSDWDISNIFMPLQNNIPQDKNNEKARKESEKLQKANRSSKLIQNLEKSKLVKQVMNEDGSENGIDVDNDDCIFFTNKAPLNSTKCKTTFPKMNFQKSDWDISNIFVPLHESIRQEKNEGKSRKQPEKLQKTDRSSKCIQNPEKSKLEKQVMNEDDSKNWIDNNDCIFFTKKASPVSTKSKITSPKTNFQKSDWDISNIFKPLQENIPQEKNDEKSRKQPEKLQKANRSLKSSQNPKMQVMNEGGSKKLESWFDDDNNDFIIFTKKIPPVSTKRKATSQELYFQSGDCDISNDIFLSSQEINSQNCLETEAEDKRKKRKNTMLGSKNTPENDNKSISKAVNSQKSNKCTKGNSQKKKEGLGLSETSRLIKKPSTTSTNSNSIASTYSKIENVLKKANIQKNKSIKQILPSKKSNVSNVKKPETTITSNVAKKPDKNNNGFAFQLNFENWLKRKNSETLIEQRNDKNLKANSSTSEKQMDKFLDENSSIISQEKVSSFVGNITLPNLINTSNINKISSFKKLKTKNAKGSCFPKLNITKHSQKSVENLTKKNLVQEKNTQTIKCRKDFSTNLSKKSLDLVTSSKNNEKVLSRSQKHEQKIDSLRKEVLTQSENIKNSTKIITRNNELISKDSEPMRKNEIPKSSKNKIMKENVDEPSHFKVPMPPMPQKTKSRDVTKKNFLSSLINEDKRSTSRKNVSSQKRNLRSESSNIDLENSIFNTSKTAQKNFSNTSTSCKENFVKNNSSKIKKILDDDLFQDQKPLRNFKRAKTKLNSKLNFDPREVLNDDLETRSVSSSTFGSSMVSQNSERSTFSRNPSIQSISSNASQNFTLPGPQHFEHLNLNTGSQRILRSRKNSTSSITSSLYSVRSLRSRNIQTCKTPNDQALSTRNEEGSISDISEYISNLSQRYDFHEATVELALAFVNPETFIVSSNEDMILTENSVGIEEFISSQNDLPEDRTLIVVIQRDYQIHDDSEKLEKKLEKNIKDDSLIYKGDPVKIRPYERKKEIVLMKIRNVFKELRRDMSNNSKLRLKHKIIEWNKCSLKNNRVVIEPKQIKYTTICFGRKNSQNKFKILIYLLKKVYNLLMMNATSTKREIYYQIINYARSQSQVDASINALSNILECPPWDFGILPTSKGLIYGPLKIFDTDGNVQEFHSEGGTLIPQDFNKFHKIESSAYFILVVEKDCIFQKLLSENVHNKLCRPFLLVTGKGYADLNTRRFLHLLWKALSIPVFIFTDADPYGIEIMLTYRFGAQNTAFMSDELILPSAKWLGILPSEFNMLNIECQKLTTHDIRKLEMLLKREYVKQNSDISQQLKIMLERNLKAEIEGVIKHHFCLSSTYIPNKLCYKNYI